MTVFYDIIIRKSYKRSKYVFENFTERDEFIFRTTIPAERNMALTFYDKIKKLKPQDYDARFINTEKDVLLKWMDYEEKNGSVFFEMINAFFLKPVSEVTFTIALNEENSAF